MNKKDKSNADFLRNALSPLDEKTAPPDELNAENTAVLVSGEKQKKNRKGKIIAFRTIGSIAAAIIIAIGIGAGIHFSNRPAIDVMPDRITNATSPVSDNTEQTIVEYFTALRADYDETRYAFAADDILDFGISADKGVLVEEGAAINSSATSGGTGAVSHGATNTQLKDVDEDDIIKNDGKYIYVLTDSSIKIIDAANMKLMSKTEIDSRGSNGLYIYKNTLIAVGSVFDEKEQTVIELYDITDKSKPALKHEFSQDGHYFSSRLTDGRIILLSKHHVFPESIELKDGYAVYNDVVPSVEVNGTIRKLTPSMISILPQENCNGTYTVMTAIDLEADGFSPVTSSVLGAGDNIFCTSKNLYVTCTKYNYRYTGDTAGMVIGTDSDVTTAIHRFSLEDGTIKPQATGEVKGRALNQFSLDEKDGYLRIATTDGEANRITVLDTALKKVAEIDGIAQGETIQSVRYIGDYGYVVTFRQTDPLFVIDFKDMKKPQIVGELKIPGFSSYLHPFNGYLVGIGTHGDDNGALNALKISLFDISDPTAPQEVDRFIVQNAYADSYHKTVMDCQERNILGFIYTESYSGETMLCTLRIKEGKIEHIASYSNAKSDESHTGRVYSSDGETDIIYYDKAMYAGESVQRATYIGDTLYTVSAHRICAYPIEGGSLIASLDF